MDLHNWIGFALEKNPLKKFQSSFLRYAMLDIGWNLSNILLAPLFFPYFKSHALDHPVTEWKGWISKGLTYPLTAKNIRQVSRQISAHKGGIFLFPLQLATDFQIREHGPKGGLVNTVQTTIESFSRHAPADALLLFKIHPLDNLRVNWHSLIKKAAINFKCSDRCLFVKGGDLNGFLSKSAGCVTVNSTVGLTAIEMGIPTHVLGKAIYKVDGLTNEKPLSTFWRNPKPPCRKLAQAFKTALISATQIRGAFDGSGAPVGARNIAARLIADHPSQF